MSALGRRLLHNALLDGGKQSDWGNLLRGFFQNERLEDWVLNEGKINVVLQSPNISVVVICWNDDLRETGIREWVHSYVVDGSVIIDGERLTKEVEHQTDHCKCLRGDLGSISVHIFRTSAKLFLPGEDVVMCNETLSITDAERGRLVSKLCSENQIQQKSPESGEVAELPLHYTNFRDLIETLHHEIEPLEPGKTHSEIHIQKICDFLQTIRLDPNEVARYARFSKSHYTRNLVGYDVVMDGSSHKPKFTVLLLCWSSGQMSPIHNHAGSSCWVKVLCGKIREIRYDDSASPPTVKRDLTLSANKVCYINDTQGLHSMGNGDENSVAISLHVYSPPYTVCSLYDPITFSKKVASMSAARTPENPFAVVPPGNQLKEFPVSLGSFYALVSTALKGKDDSLVSKLVNRLVFQPNEWAEFVHFDKSRYTRSLISLDSTFSLMICSWNTDQATPLHSHGTNTKCWVKVLSGSLQLKLFSGTRSNPTLEKTLVFEEGSMVNHDLFTGLHILGNSSSEHPAVSLHLFTPPSVNMAYFDDSGMERVIPVVHSAHSTTIAAERCCAADPIHACDRAIERSRTISIDDETESEASSVFEDSRENKVEELLSFFQKPQDSRLFTNLSALIRFISVRNLSVYPSEQTVMLSLNHMELCAEEWQSIIGKDECCSPAQLIARGKNYSLSICRVDPHSKWQCTHFSHSTFIKILQGELVVSQYLESDLVHNSVVNTHGGVFVSSKLDCQLENLTHSPCFAMFLARESA